MQKFKWFGGLGVPQGHQQHNNSIEHIQLHIQLQQKLCIYLVSFSSYSELFVENGRV